MCSASCSTNVFTFDKAVETYETLVDPKRVISPESIEIHNITDAMVEGKPTIEEVLRDVLKMIAKHPIVGHGVQFDALCVSLEASF